MRSRPTIRLVVTAALAGVVVAGLISLTGFGLSLAAWLGVAFALAATVIEFAVSRERGEPR